jgi:hypothetical protein
VKARVGLSETLVLYGCQNVVGQSLLRLLVHAGSSLVGACNHRKKVKPGENDDLIAAIS